MRVAFASRGLTNPLGFLWPEALREMGHETGHVDFATVDGRHGDDGSLDLSAIALAPPGPLARRHAAIAEATMGGPPDVVVAYWGTGSIEYGQWARGAWPGVPIVLCVDTFPNASVPLTEAREVFRLRRLLRDVAGCIYFNAPMRDLHHRRSRQAARVPCAVVPQPLSSRIFAEPSVSLPEHLRLAPRSGGEPPRIVFTGRADYLFSRDRRMGKDALGSTLQSLTSAGAELFVPGFREVDPSSGFQTYPVLTNAQMLDGTFANFLAQFDAQLALYRPVNRTIRRRLTTSLSTRFGLAFTAPTTIVVPHQSTFAVEQLTRLDLGLALQDPAQLVGSLDADRWARTERAWHSNHHSFSAESLASDLSALFETVTRA